MLSIQISINIFLLGGSLLAAVIIGFLFRSKQLKKLRRRVGELEKELLSNHADILELQKDKTVLEQKLKETTSIPVIPITASTDEIKQEKIQEVAMRKKLLSNQSADKR